MECLPAIAAPEARRTHHVIERLQLLGHTAGGRPGEMLAARLAIPASDNTILRQLKRRAATRAKAPVRVAGIDDWSGRKGWTYGTIIVDLERREVVDVISERSMRRQRIGSRDTLKWRSCVATDAGCTRKARLRARHRRGKSPTASTSYRICGSRSSGRCLASAGLLDARCRRRPTVAAPPVWKTIFSRTAATGVGRPTVRQWVRSGRLADRAAVTPTVRSPRYFKDYLSRRWDAGCINGGQLLHEIKRLGYTGCYSHPQRFLAGWRRANRESPTRSEPPAEESRAIDPATGWQISPIAAASLCMTSSGLLTPTQAAKVQALKQASPSFIAMRQPAMRFRGILRSGGIDKRDKWLDEADRCGLPAIQRFARTVNHDLEAVRNAATERWSNGPVEGQINRLKTLKRAMYGRAGVELLRARLLPFS